MWINEKGVREENWGENPTHGRPDQGESGQHYVCVSVPISSGKKSFGGRLKVEESFALEIIERPRLH